MKPILFIMLVLSVISCNSAGTNTSSQTDSTVVTSTTTSQSPTTVADTATNKSNANNYTPSQLPQQTPLLIILQMASEWFHY